MRTLSNRPNQIKAPSLLTSVQKYLERGMRGMLYVYVGLAETATPKAVISFSTSVPAVT